MFIVSPTNEDDAVVTANGIKPLVDANGLAWCPAGYVYRRPEKKNTNRWMTLVWAVLIIGGLYLLWKWFYDNKSAQLTSKLVQNQLNKAWQEFRRAQSANGATHPAVASARSALDALQTQLDSGDWSRQDLARIWESAQHSINRLQSIFQK